MFLFISEKSKKQLSVIINSGKSKVFKYICLLDLNIFLDLK